MKLNPGHKPADVLGFKMTNVFAITDESTDSIDINWFKRHTYGNTEHGKSEPGKIIGFECGCS